MALLDKTFLRMVSVIVAAVASITTQLVCALDFTLLPDLPLQGCTGVAANLLL